MERKLYRRDNKRKRNRQERLNKNRFLKNFYKQNVKKKIKKNLNNLKSQIVQKEIRITEKKRNNLGKWL